MKLARLIPLVLALIVLTGCPSTPARKAFITAETGTSAIQAVNDAATLSPDFRKQLPKLERYVDAVSAASLALDQAILAGKVDLSSYTTALNEAVIALLNAKATASKVAATQP